MLTIAICDDDLKFAEIFMEMLEKSFINESIECEMTYFESGNKVLECGTDFDLYFLDVQMPGVHGLEVAELIRKKRGKVPGIIFVTAYEDVVYDVFEYDIICFIRKMQVKDDLKKATDIILRKLQERKSKISLKCKGLTIYKTIEEIIYVEVYSHKLMVHCTDGNYSTRYSLDELEIELSKSNFIRTHRCYLVNPRYIRKIERQSVILDGEIEVPLSKHKVGDVKKKYLNYTVKL